MWDLVHKYAPVDFGPEFNDAIDILSTEMGNISSVIDHAVANNSGDPVLDIAIKNIMFPTAHISFLSHLVPSVCLGRCSRAEETSAILGYFS